jgi:hypothetical protein
MRPTHSDPNQVGERAILCRRPAAVCAAVASVDALTRFSRDIDRPTVRQWVRRKNTPGVMTVSGDKPGVAAPDTTSE